MSGDSQSLAVENALLRGTLFLTARALKGYQEAKHTPGDDGRLHLSVLPAESARAAEALARADYLLRDKDRTR